MDYLFIMVYILIGLGAGLVLRIGCFYDINFFGKNKFIRSMFFLIIFLAIWISGFIIGAYLENL